jgi:intergrase/recombinase
MVNERMIRAQIQFTEDQLKALRQIAKRLDRSVADVVREGVDQYVSSQGRVRTEEEIRRALSVVGKYRSGVSDLGANHDKYLAEAFEE